MKYIVEYWEAGEEDPNDDLSEFFFTEHKKLFESKKDAEDFYNKQKNALEVVKIEKPKLLK